jgi:hypothetical protein
MASSKEEVIALFKKVADATFKAHKLYTRLEFPARVNPTHVERSFSLPVPGLPSNIKLVGSMDIDDVSRSTIFDLKNSESHQHSNPIQLMVYGLAKRLLGEPYGRAAFLYPLLLKNPVDAIRFTDSDLDTLQDNLSDLAVEIMNGSEPDPVQGSWCYMCEFNKTRHCPATYKPNGFEREDHSKPYEVALSNGRISDILGD